MIQVIEMIDKSQIDNVQPEPQRNSEQQPISKTSSPTIGNTSVVRSPKSDNERVSILSTLPKLDMDKFEKRMKSYDDLFKMWGLDTP
jgi:hypothetical protein